MTTGSVAKVSVLHHTTNAIINQQAALLKKPTRSRVDYNFFNYCSQCDLKLSKQTLRCPECKQKLDKTMASFKSYAIQTPCRSLSKNWLLPADQSGGIDTKNRKMNIIKVFYMAFNPF